MNANEWVELLDYLIKRLTDLGASDFANAVRQSSLLRIIDNAENTFSLREKIPKAIYHEVGELTTRLRTPEEAVFEALNLLKVRLEMLPSVSEALAKNLDVEPAHIVWKTETREHLYTAQPAEFSALSLFLSDQERTELEKKMKVLSSLVLDS